MQNFSAKINGLEITKVQKEKVTSPLIKFFSIDPHIWYSDKSFDSNQPY